MSTLNPVFIPGPTNIPDRLQLAMQVQTQDHRAPDFVETFAPVLEDSKKVIGTTSGQMITFPASGTGGWEVAVSPAEKLAEALAAMETAELPRTFFDFPDMKNANASGGFPYTPPLQLIYGMRKTAGVWGLELVATSTRIR